MIPAAEAPCRPVRQAQDRPLNFGVALSHDRSWQRALALKVYLVHGVVGILALTLSPLIPPESWWTLVPFCLASMLTISYMVYHTAKANPPALLHEMGVFLGLAVGTYFAFGPLVFVFGTDQAIQYTRSWHPVYASGAIWLTGLNFCGFCVTGFVLENVRFPFLAKVAERTAASWGGVHPEVIFVVFAISGAIAKYFFVVPFDLRLIDLAPTGLMRQCDGLIVISVMVGSACRSGSRVWVLPLTRCLLVLQVATGLLLFNKNASLLPVIAYGFGGFVATRNFPRLLASALSCLVLYVFLVPVVAYGRLELSPRSGSEPVPADLWERQAITLRYFQGGASTRLQESVEGTWWVRLCYVPAQQAGKDLYEQDQGGDDFEKLPWIVVPRMIFPQKPEMTVAGVDFNEKVAGYRTTSTGTGVFLDGYYNLGWVGFLIVSVTYGISLRVFAYIAMAVLRHRSMVMFPIVFLGIHSALRADGWWLADVMGPLAIVLAGLSGLAILSGRVGRAGRTLAPA